MPKTCIHLEKVENIIKNLNVKYSNNRWEYPYGPFLGIEDYYQRTHFSGTAASRSQDDSYFFKPEIRIVYEDINRKVCCTEHSSSTSESIIAEIKKLKEAEVILNRVKNEIISIINKCNCGNENNQQLVLRRNAETEKSNLEVAKRSLESRISDLRTENARLDSRNDGLRSENSRLGDLIRAGERELTTKNNQIVEKDRQITNYSTQLTTAQGQLTTVKNELTTERNQHRELIRQFTALQITINNKDNEITSLKEELENSQNIDLRYKERKLDELVRNSGLNRVRVINLRDAYERLMRAREDYNLNNITNANNEIEIIKAEFFQTNVNINDLHKIYKTCEKIAELRVKQEKLHEQQYQAHQEQPTNN